MRYIMFALAVGALADKPSMNMRAFKCPHARLWLEHGAEKASEMLGIKSHKLASGAAVERCSLAEGFPGGAHQDARSPGYDSNCSGTPGELSPYQWPLAFTFEHEETTMNYDSDEPTAENGGRTWYLLNKNWKRTDYLTGHKPGRPASDVASLDNTTVIHRNEQIIYVKWKDNTDHKDVSTIESCTAHRVGGIGNIRPDWFMDSRPYLTNDIASQYLGNQHVYHRGEPTLVKQWRKSDFANNYFVMSMKEHVGEDGIHWPLMIDIPGEGAGPDTLRSMYNHEVFEATNFDMFLIDQEYVAAGGSCPSNTPPPSPDSWMCAVCAKVYDPETDGEGLAFEDLTEDWVCPRCGAPKAAYKQDAGTHEWVLETSPAFQPPHEIIPSALTKDPCVGVDGPCTESFWRDIEYTFSPVWVPPAPAPPPSDYKCNICKHIYDPDQDGEGVAFVDLADDWLCPICGAPKTAYEGFPMHKVSDVFTVV